MRKKILILLLGLVGTFSVAYMDHSDFLYAANSNQRLTGRSGELQKGDNVLLEGGANASGPLGWKLMVDTATSINPVNNGWFALTTRPIDHVKMLASGTVRADDLYTNTQLPSYISQLNATFTAQDLNIINPRYYGNLINAPFWSSSSSGKWLAGSTSIMEYISWSKELDKAFTPTLYEMLYTPTSSQDAHGVGVSSKDLKYSEPYYSGSPGSSAPENRDKWRVIQVDGSSTNHTFGTSKIALRAAVYLNLDQKNKTVFSLANGYTTDGAYVDAPVSTSYDDASNMKVRLLDTSRGVSLDRIEKDISGTVQPISIINNKSNFILHVDNIINPNVKPAKISFIMVDTDGNMAYYNQLMDADDTIPTSGFEIDTTGLKADTYQLYLVNEVITSDNSPTYSSAYSNGIALEIVDEVAISITNTPQNQATFEYSKNVSQGMQVAKITTTGGAGTITYSVVSDTSVSGHSNDYTKFDIGTDASGNPIVIVKDSNGLDAGDYYFKVNAIDANGDPTGGVDSSTVHINVAKTDPNLAFTNKTDPVNVKVSGTAFTEAFTHTNTDTSEIVLSYASSIPGVATVDSSTGTGDLDVEITPGATSGNTTITVSLDATKNYKAASITKTIHTYPNLALSFTPKSSAFSINDVATIGSEVGTLTLTGDSADYTYSMATDPNAPAGSDAGNGYFEVQKKTATSDKTMKIVTQLPNVPQGTHKITMKAVDQYNQAVYVSGTITVSGKVQTGFEFHDYRNTSVILTNKTLTLYYGETKAQLIALGGESSGGIKYDLETGEPTNIIDVDSAGNITVKDIGTVKVKAIHEKDNTYSEAVINMFVEVKPCEQTITFKDTTDPKEITYDSSNPTIVQDAIGKIKTGMPNEGNAGHGIITYSPSDPSVVVDTSGNVTLTDPGSSMKSFTLTAKINDPSNKATYDPHYTTETITKTIKVYPKGSASWNQSNQPQADNNAINDKVGKVTVSGGAGTPSFSIPKTTTTDNIDYPFFDIDSAGNVMIKKAITHNDLMGKTINTAQNAYEMKIEVEVTNGGTTTTLPITIYIKGAPRTGLEFDDKDPLTMEITKTYKEAPNNTFPLGLNQVITGTTITYSMSSDAGNPTDVITVAPDGTATILNANEGGSYQPAKVEALIPMCDGYEETIVKGNVRIIKADQTLVFSQDPINTDISVSSLNVAITGHKDSHDLVYSSSDSDIDIDSDPSDPNQMIIKPNGKAVNGVVITAVASGDRNYNSTTKTATLNISGTPAQHFTAIFPKMTYGDSDPKAVTITPSDPSATYTYTVKDTNILEIDTSGNITIHHAGDTTVLVSKTDASGTLGPYSFNVSVKPKLITVTIDDKEKYVGTEVPAFTSQITNGTLVGSDTLGTLTFSCMKKDNTPVNKATEAGTYPITGRYVTPNTDYKVTIVNGTLTVKQDTGETPWYHLEDIDGNPTTASKWHKDPVDIVLNPSSIAAGGTYDQIGNSIAFTNAGSDPTRFTVSEEGETKQDIYFRIDPNGSSPNKGAITSPIQETILIDLTAPTIKTITAADTNNKLQDIINQLSGGIFFKPGTAFEITTSDEKGDVKVSGTASIEYKLYKQNNDKTYGTPIKQDTITVTNEKANITIADTTGTYKICVLPKDHAGNVPEQEPCKELTLKKINVDIDGDGKDDFNDPDGNGCADFNIIYIDEEDGKQKILNVDANRDGIPEMNIDSDGDGKPDINVDTDNDGKPDLNLMILTKSDSQGTPSVWKPTKCVTQHGEQYASGVDLTPLINVDTNHDGVPDINIDNKGDFKPHLNVVNQTKYGETKTNLIEIHKWTPDHDFTVQQFDYDSIKAKPVLDIDTDGDGLPDLNIDIDGDGSADLNIDTDGDYIPNVQIDTNGDGKANINIDHNQDGIPDQSIVNIEAWVPNKDVTDGKLYDTMELPMLDYIEDAGIQVKPKDTSVKLLPNFALKVSDVTKEKKEEMINTVLQGNTDKDIVSVYHMELLKDNNAIQPYGTMTVRIPIVEGLKNPSIMLEYEKGKFKPIQPRIEDGYYVFETDYIGSVMILNDIEQTTTTEPEPSNTVEPGDDIGGGTTDSVKTSVKGTYTNGGTLGDHMGGVSTGDATSIWMMLIVSLLSGFGLVYIIKRFYQDRIQ